MSETLLDLLASQARATPDALALVDEGRHWTYRQMLAAIHQRAHIVLERTRARQPRVGLLVARGERTAETLLWFLGILRAAAVGVPIDASTPPERFDALVEDAQVTWMCGHREALYAFSRTRTWPQVRPLDLDAWDPLMDEGRTDAPVWAPTTEDLAYILHTTGTTTGRPKGVMVSHGSLAFVAQVQQERFRVRPGERATQFFSLTFDASLSELMLLVSGATLYPVQRAHRFGGRDLVRWMEQERITIATFTPSFWSRLPIEPGDLPDLRLLILGGEDCPSSLIARTWRPGLTIFNAYGLTEATVCSSLSICVPGQPVTLGQPLRGMTMTVRDERLRVLPAGESGQLCLAGPGLAQGYTDEALTAERFVTDPQTHERLLLTRDRAVQHTDGSFLFLGRLDETRRVKVRGKLVDLDEIEGLLQQQDLVQEAAVVIDAGGRIIAAVALCPGVALGEAEVGNRLEAALKNVLLDYMLPRAYVVLPALPRNRNEKLDRERLQREVPVAWRRPSTFRQAESAVERGIADIVAGMLTAQARQRAALSRLLNTEDAAVPRDEPVIGWEQINLAVPASEQAGESLESLDAPDFVLWLIRLFGIEVASTELFVPLVLVAEAIEHRLAERRQTEWAPEGRS